MKFYTNMLFYLPTATLVIVFLEEVSFSEAVSTSDDQHVFDLAKTLQDQATILQEILQSPPLHQDLASEDDDLSDQGKKFRHLQDKNGLSDTCIAETESILDKIDPAAYDRALSYFPQDSWEMDAFLERNCDVNYRRESIDCDMKHDFSSDSRFLASECELHGGQVIAYDVYARCRDTINGVSIDMEWDMENAMECFWPECTDNELDAEIENVVADTLLDMEDFGNCELQISRKNEGGLIFKTGGLDSSANSPSGILGSTILAISGGLTILYSAFQ